ncbi:MAG: ribonuclease III [Rhizobiaceae bacterium]|nr:ribonuclease III [Rhizobiaceae bacterium]
MSGTYSDRGKRRFGILEERIGYQFTDFSNLERALTHSSVRKNSDDNFHYERLEFLGDRVLGICIAELLFKEFPKAVEGELSLRLNALVKGKTLAQISDRLQLHEFIRTGGDLKQITGKRMQSVRADVLEALIASIYLDGGLPAAEKFIQRFWKERIHDVKAARRDSKTALQEWAHAEGFGTPRYFETARTGPDHDPEFTVSVQIGDDLEEAGHGRSKRSAEQDAAAKLLIAKGIWKDGDASSEME